MNWKAIWKVVKPAALLVAGAVASYVCTRWGVCS